MRKVTRLPSNILLNSLRITTPHQDPQCNLQIHNTRVKPLSLYRVTSEIKPMTTPSHDNVPRPHHTMSPHGKYFVIHNANKTRKDNSFIVSVWSMDKFNQFALYATLLYCSISFLWCPLRTPPRSINPSTKRRPSQGDGWCQFTIPVSVRQLPLQCPLQWVQSSSSLTGGHLAHLVT